MFQQKSTSLTSFEFLSPDGGKKDSGRPKQKNISVIESPAL